MSSSGPEAAALALFRAGRLAEAEAAYRAVLEREPRNPTALHMVGFILATTGRRDAGLALIDRSIEAAPRNAAFLDNRAQVLMQAGRDDDALRDLERAAQLEPRSFEVWLHLSRALRRLGRRDDALRAIGKALALDAGHGGAGYHEGLLHLEGGDFTAAEASLRRVLQREPNNVPVLSTLGLALHRGGRTGDAIELFKRALALRPGFGQALLNWGNALRDGGDLEGARARYDEALTADPDFVEALVNGASALLESERPQDARALYERAAAVRPGYPDAYAGLAQVQLRARDFANGWKNYERRFDTVPPAARPRPMSLPRLTGASLTQARRVAVWLEQGIGDQILFSTLLPELCRRGIASVVEVDPRLAGLYRRSLPDVEFVTPAESAEAFARCDCHVPAGSLPGLFRPDVASFAAQPRALLRADPQRVAAYRAQLGPAPAIAISWRSLLKGKRKTVGDRKSIPLEHFARLAQATGARLVDLQYGDVSEERLAFEARHPGVLVRLEGLDAFADLEGLAAALEACGRLVSSSNVTAHLAGALGVPTQLLYLRGWAPFFNWVPGPGSRSLWYPSVEVPAAAWEGWEEAFEALQPGAQ